ncbi:MAG: malonyl-CoA decarboxylase family protein [Granulosicoccus sp.]
MSRISYLSELLSSVFVRQEQSSLAEPTGSFVELCDALLSQRGEMSGNRLAGGLFSRFAKAEPEEQLAFFKMLLSRFDINAEHAVRAAQRYADDKTADGLTILIDSVEPRRQELFRRLNRLPGATNELVKMRALLLSACRQEPDLRRIDVDFQHLFRSWFNQGFLVLREIDWHSPANILEKIIAYEAVHEISSWSDLRGRLQPSDRRCFAFFHPSMLDEPLIFVEVALTNERPETIAGVLESDREIIAENDATMAVFYSISNCQKGLAGVSFGNFLIKQVAKELSAQLPNLTSFRTLSPVPGLSRWIDSQLEAHSPRDSDLDSPASDAHALLEHLRIAKRVSEQLKESTDLHELEQLQLLVAHFLTLEKREDLQPLDPVARFHLGNGASLDAVLPGADMSEKGLRQSSSVMVSYLYDLEKIEENHEAYANEREVITSSVISALFNRPRRARKRA